MDNIYLQINSILFQQKIQFLFQGFIWLSIFFSIVYTFLKKEYLHIFHWLYGICFSFYYIYKFNEVESSFYATPLFYLAIAAYLFFLLKISKELLSTSIIYFRLFVYINICFAIIYFLLLFIVGDNQFLIKAELVIQVIEILFFVYVGIIFYQNIDQEMPILMIGHITMTVAYMVDTSQTYLSPNSVIPFDYFQIGISIYLVLYLVNAFSIAEKTAVLLKKEKYSLSQTNEQLAQKMTDLKNSEKDKLNQSIAEKQSLIHEKETLIKENNIYLNCFSSLSTEKELTTIFKIHLFFSPGEIEKL